MPRLVRPRDARAGPLHLPGVGTSPQASTTPQVAGLQSGPEGPTGVASDWPALPSDLGHHTETPFRPGPQWLGPEREIGFEGEPQESLARPGSGLSALVLLPPPRSPLFPLAARKPRRPDRTGGDPRGPCRGSSVPIVCDPEPRGSWPQATTDARKSLANSVLPEGCPEPPMVWPCAGKRLLPVDYDRPALAGKQGIPCTLVPKPSDGRKAARNFIGRHRLTNRLIAQAWVGFRRGRR